MKFAAVAGVATLMVAAKADYYAKECPAEFYPHPYYGCARICHDGASWNGNECICPAEFAYDYYSGTCNKICPAYSAFKGYKDGYAVCKCLEGFTFNTERYQCERTYYGIKYDY